MFLFILSSFFLGCDCVKVWIPNTDINNNLNWDTQTRPRDCDNILFKEKTEVATYWNLKKIVVSGLSLPQTGDVIFSQNVDIQFRNKEKCNSIRDNKYIRNEIKGWLDPHNWKSDSKYQWLPHVERVPCAGEQILFPPQRTFAVQLPNILIPTGDIIFDAGVFRGDTWSEFLNTELGFQLFKGPDAIRSIPWRNDIGCLNNKKCICGRSPYSIKDGVYAEVKPIIFEEAVCLYAKPKCPISACYSAVIPTGHCCSICGAVIKLEDNTENGINISDIRAKVETEAQKYDPNEKLKTYVGRTREENIQIVIVAEDSDDTIKSHTLANIIKKRLVDEKLRARISSYASGLQFSNYLFNSISGAVFGTLIAVLVLFVSLYYIYLILPKKQFPTSSNPFVFARFDNIVNEDNLENGVEPEASLSLPQGFDNPMYSASKEPEKDKEKKEKLDVLPLESEETSNTATTIKEYTNPVYTEIEKTKLEDFPEEPQKEDKDEFSEIKL